MKILIVDDNPDDRLLLKYSLEQHGHETREAGNGKEGLEKAAQFNPNLIVSDAMMPEMDGFHFLKKLKENDILKSIPFVYYSAVYTGDQETSLGFSLGAQAYIIKEGEPEKAWNKLQEIITKIEKNEIKTEHQEIARDQEFFENYSSIVVSKLEDKLKELKEEIELRKKTEAALRESEEKFRTLFESSQDAIVLMDETGIIDFNARTLQIFGCTYPEELILQNLSRFAPANQPDGESSDVLMNAHITSTWKNGSCQFEWQYSRMDKTEFPAEVLLTPLTLGGKKILQSTIRDISLRKNMENQLFQSAKMATLGEMAAGIAHEINQPMTVLKMGAQLIERLYKSGQLTNEFVVDQIDKFNRHIDRIIKIINHLRIFGRKISEKNIPVNINIPIKNAIDLVENQMRIASINLELDLDQQLPNAIAEENSLEQVFINILLNAIDSLLTDENLIQKKILIKSRYDSDSRQIIAQISNNGPEIAKSIIDKIFEPFFTTKDPGKGTGLGLSISYGILNSYGGNISAKNMENGPCFTITLPVENSNIAEDQDH